MSSAEIDSHATWLFSFCPPPCPILWASLFCSVSQGAGPMNFSSELPYLVASGRVLTMGALAEDWGWRRERPGTYFFYTLSANPQFCQWLHFSARGPNLHRGGISHRSQFLPLLCFSQRELTDSHWCSPLGIPPCWFLYPLTSDIVSSTNPCSTQSISCQESDEENLLDSIPHPKPDCSSHTILRTVMLGTVVTGQTDLSDGWPRSPNPSPPWISHISPEKQNE